MAEDTEQTEQQETFPPVPKRKRAKAAHAGHHGGAWKVAYADFITTMMALFLLLWLLSTSDQASRVMLSLYFRDPGIFDNPQGRKMSPGSGAAPKTKAVPILEVAGSGGAGQLGTENSINMEQMARALHRELNQSPTDQGADRQVAMIATKDGMQIQLSDSGERDLFVKGSAVVTRETEKMLRQIGSIIAAMKDYSIAIEGHTDSSPPLNLKYNNRDLSADRAQRVMQMLVASGVPPNRFKSLVGHGDNWLLDKRNPLSAYNRRVVITLKARRDVADATHIRSIPSTIPSTGFGESPPPTLPIESTATPDTLLDRSGLFAPNDGIGAPPMEPVGGDSQRGIFESAPAPRHEPAETGGAGHDTSH